MTSFDDLIAGLSPEVRKKQQVLTDVNPIVYPLASRGLTWITNGGVAGGRLTLLYGSSGAGKSLLMLQSIALWQSMGLSVVYLDVEGTVTPEFARKFGVDTDKFVYLTERGFGPATDALMPYIRGGADIVICDTYSDLIPDGFVEKGQMKSYDDTKQVGAHAKSTVRMLNSLMYELKPNTALIMMSQTTTFMGMSHVEQIPHGGEKAKFKASTMLRLNAPRSLSGQIKGKEQLGDKTVETMIGRKVTGTCTKSKFGPEFKTIEYDMYYDGPELGLDLVKENIELAARYGVMEMTSAGRYAYEDSAGNYVKVWKKKFLEEPELYQKITKELDEAMAAEKVRQRG